MGKTVKLCYRFNNEFVLQDPLYVPLPTFQAPEREHMDTSFKDRGFDTAWKHGT